MVYLCLHISPILARDEGISRTISPCISNIKSKILIKASQMIFFADSSNWCNSEVQFRCKNGFCIRSWKKCDGVKHCSDGSDEAHCSLCRPDQFKCEDSRCIDKKLVCNGIKDCSESEDEIGCGKFLFLTRILNKCKAWLSSTISLLPVI